MPDLMTPALLRRCADAYSREAGTAGLAEALGVEPRTVRRWLSGETPIPASLPAELAPLLLRRAADVQAAGERQAFECERLARQLAD